MDIATHTVCPEAIILPGLWAFIGVTQKRAKLVKALSFVLCFYYCKFLGRQKTRKHYFLVYSRQIGENNKSRSFEVVFLVCLYVEQTTEETICLYIVCVYLYPD